MNVIASAGAAAIAQAAMHELLLQVADQLATEAAHNAPVRTGTLRDSIHVEDQNIALVSVVAGAPYAAYVELGTRKMAAEPYMMPALFNAVGA